MPLILLVEQEGRYIERIQDALSAEGWQVKVVNQWAAAVRMATTEVPDLLVVSPEIPEAEGLLSSFSRRNGGPGTIVLVPERDAARASAQLYGCDEVVIKPAVEKDLKRAVRRLLASRDAAQPLATAAPSRALSSSDIFGDLLRDLEGDAGPARSALLGVTAPEVPQASEAPSPGGSAGVASATRRASESSALDRRLEETLSGILSSSKVTRPAPAASPAPPPAPVAASTTPDAAPKAVSPRPAAGSPPAGSTSAKSAARERADDVDALLQRTLTDINWKPSRVSTGMSGAFPTVSAPETTPAAKPSEGPQPAVANVPLDKTTRRIPGLARFAVEGSKNFGPYTLVERIAVGGMAEVWKATRGGLEGFTKTVAIKRILSHLNDSPEFVAMLIDEAKLAALLEHPNITQIYDLGKIGDDHFIAMEFVEGKDLRAVLQAARARGEMMPLGLALLVASRVAGALDYAHHLHDAGGRELRLVHRDVSPQNVLFGFAGQIKLCDFGIVKAVSKTNQTQMGALKGKLQYMSPEQAWGRSVDARSDVFSLGAVLFEMISGRRLFVGSSEVSILDSVRAGRTDRLAEVVPTVAPELDELVAKALRANPEDRFQSAGEMQKAIDGARQKLRPAPTEGELRDWVRGLFGLAPVDGTSVSEKERAAVGVLSAVELETPVVEAEFPLANQPAVLAVSVSPAATTSPILASKSGMPSWSWAAGGLALLGIALAIGMSIKGRGVSPAASSPAATESGVPAVIPTGDGAAPAATAAEGLVTSGSSSASSPVAGTAGLAAARQTPPAASPELMRLIDEQSAQREKLLREQFERERKRLEDEIARNRGTSEPASTGGGPSATPGAPAPSDAEAVSERPADPAPTALLPAPVPATQEAPPAVTDLESPPPGAASPPQVTVQRGDLVRPGPGVVAPSLVSRLEPRYPALARERRVQATVTAEILVDENGAILESRLRIDGPDVGFSDAIRDALRGARFRPATKDGVPVKMWKVLSFPFRG